MSDWFECFSSLTQTVMIMTMARSIDGIVKAVIATQLEKRLGRPLTDWDWWCYQNELVARAWRRDWDSRLNRQRQMTIDYQIIRNFVWEEEE